MTKIAIFPESQSPTTTTDRAVAGQRQSVGKTPGEALDSLTAQLGNHEAGTLIVVQHMQPGRFFTAQQQQRLAELMDRWRAARAAGSALPSDEQTELEALTAAELEGATQRAAAPLRELQP